MINASAQGVARPQSLSAPVVRPTAGLFWAGFALIGVCIAGVLLAIAASLPERLPLARGADVLAVREAIVSRLNGTSPDPLIELTPGVTARQSNIRGFALGGRTYYYSLAGQHSFDPLSRGDVSEQDIEIVLRDDRGAQPIVVYYIIRPNTSS